MSRIDKFTSKRTEELAPGVSVTVLVVVWVGTELVLFELTMVLELEEVDGAEVVIGGGCDVVVGGGIQVVVGISALVVGGGGGGEGEGEGEGGGLPEPKFHVPVSTPFPRGPKN
jgi:hypothetical protein